MVVLSGLDGVRGGFVGLGLVLMLLITAGLLVGRGIVARLGVGWLVVTWLIVIRSAVAWLIFRRLVVS